MKSTAYFVSLWSGVLMLILVLAGAVAFAFTDFMSDRFYGNKRTAFIFVLLAYALYRGFRIYRLLKSGGPENQN